MPEEPNREVVILNAALELRPVERAAYLDEACAGDAALRERVEALLRAHEEAGTFLESSPATLTLASTPVTEKAGDRIGRYKLLQEIGEGGCGVVYMAEQEEPVRRRVALKIIKLGMDTKQVIARFEAERQALALMDHPNIAKVLDAGATETGRPFFVMELVRGVPITVYCDENNVPMQQRLELFIQVCQAVQHAHQKGIIHRDIKPSNILVTVNDGVPVPKVIDFGIAKATTGQQLTDKTLFTAFEQFIGTPAYMSPEQAVMTSLDVDTRSDLYSLGVLLYELLTGKTPFDPKELLQAGFDEMRRTIREQEPAKPSTRLSTMLEGELTMTAKRRRIEAPKLVHLVRGDLDWIVMKCLEKDRTRRYETANGLAADIKRHLNNEPIVARPPSKLYEFQKTVQRHKFGFGAAAALIIVLAAGVIVSTREAIRAVRAEREQVRLRQIAETKEKKSEQVAQFLKDMLKGVGPSVALGRDTTMLREILDKTAERIDADLKDQPEVQIELGLTLAQTYLDLQLFKQAEETARETLRLARSHLGQENLAVADALGQLGRALNFVRKLDESETVTREAIAMQRKLRGNDSLEEADALLNLCDVLRNQWDKSGGPDDRSKLAEAETAIRASLAIRKKRLGSEHPDVAKSLDPLSLLLSWEGRPVEAERASRESVAIRQKLLGDEHPDLAGSWTFLGLALFKQGKLEEAEACLRKSLAIQTKMQTTGGWFQTIALEDLAAVLQKEGKLDEAETCRRQALAIMRKLRGDDDPEVAKYLLDLAYVLQSQGKLAEAETLYREGLALRERKIPDHWWTFNDQSLLGDNLLRQKKYAEAEPLLLSGYEGMKQRERSIPKYGKVFLKKAIERLVQLYKETERPDEVAKWNQELSEFEKAEAEGKAAAP